MFASSGIATLRLPSTLKKLEDYAFIGCKSLKNVQLPHKLEHLGRSCFAISGITELTLPSGLKEVGHDALSNCGNLRTIYVEDGCEASLSNAGVPNSTTVLPLVVTIGGVNIADLRRSKDVTIPDGTERVGNHWFWRSDIENVVIPASVKEIGTDAFCRCEKLKKIVFEGARKTSIGS